jgi:hypothetical protein
MRWLLLLLVGCSIEVKVGEQCTDAHFKRVQTYLYDKCFFLFTDKPKCEKLVEDRIKELKEVCFK